MIISIILGVLIGISIAFVLALLIGSIVLLKSNDIGSDVAGIEQYTGYAPIECENIGRVD